MACITSRSVFDFFDMLDFLLILFSSDFWRKENDTISMRWFLQEEHNIVICLTYLLVFLPIILLVLT